MPLPNHSTRKRPGRRQWFTRRNRGNAPSAGLGPSRCKSRNTWGRTKEALEARKSSLAMAKEGAKEVAIVRQEAQEPKESKPVEAKEPNALKRSLKRLAGGRWGIPKQEGSE